MSRTRIGAALALLALALLTLPAGASADTSSPTWEGTWRSTFGEIKMTASGSGTYPNCGVITPEGLSDGGRTNKGKWTECSSNGKYEFHMSASGLTFDGSYTRGESDTCVFPPCDWDGECISGACKENDDPAPAQPRACGASVVNAFAAAKTCDLGKLPFGSEWSVPAPKAGSTVDISPEPTRPTAHELLAALRELIAEEEEHEIAVTLAVNTALTKSGGDDFGSDAFSGCLMMGEGVGADARSINPEEGRLALVRACVRLLLRSQKPGVNARAAAGGCKAVFVPAFPKGRKVTKRMRRRAVAAAEERIAASCKQRRVGRLSFSIRARGKRATLPEVIGGRRLRAKVARRVPEGAPEQRLGVRWRQRTR